MLKDQDMDQDDLPGFDLQGHEGAEQIFLDAYNADRLHHAWLITGPRGIGKASLAQRIARFMLHHPPANTDSPGLFGTGEDKVPQASLSTDPQSASNMIITAGGHGGLITVTRQVNEQSGKLRAEIIIEDVRKLQGFFSMTSFEGGWRVAIIDSADEMNRNAANALLKLLEEPPKNTLLILVAHAPGRLLATITSRCRKLRLNPLPHDIVKKILRERYPDLTASEISGYAVLSDGSPGYAIRLVENQGLELYSRILDILATLPELDVPLLHKLADSLATKKSEQKYTLFTELLSSFITRMIRHVAAMESSHESPVKETLAGEGELMERLGQRLALDQWVELWEKILDKTGRINLDRRQVILNILTLINQKI